MTFAQQLRAAQLRALIANGEMLVEHLTTEEHFASSTDDLQHACDRKCAAIASTETRRGELWALLSGATAPKSPPALDSISVASGSRG